jgi:hypothetical protein
LFLQPFVKLHLLFCLHQPLQPPLSWQQARMSSSKDWLITCIKNDIIALITSKKMLLTTA